MAVPDVAWDHGVAGPSWSMEVQQSHQFRSRISSLPSAFMLFAQGKMRSVAAKNPNEKNQRVRSHLGKVCPSLNTAYKETYQRMVTDTAAVYRTKCPDHAYDLHQAHQRKQQERRLRCTSPGASPWAPLLHVGIVQDSRSPFRCTSCSCAFNEGDAYSRHLGCHQRTGFCFRCSRARLFGDEEEIRAHLEVHEIDNGQKTVL